MKYLVPCLIVALIVLHQDYWQWHDQTLDFGFLPRALTYHASLSVLAAIVWWMAVQWCWPEEGEVEAAASGTEDAGKENAK